jgi:hypothetical protein
MGSLEGIKGITATTTGRKPWHPSFISLPLEQACEGCTTAELLLLRVASTLDV